MATAPTHSASSAGGSLLHLARRPLLAALTMLLAAAGALGASHMHHAEALSLQQNAQADLAQAAAELAEAEQARDRLEANLREFEALQRVGFVREPDRVALLERLEASLALAPDVSLRWVMSPSLALLTDVDATGQPVAHRFVLPMKIEAGHMHEVEWMQLLAQLQRPEPSRMRAHGCEWKLDSHQWGGDTVKSMRGVCDLLWFYVVPEKASLSENQAQR